MNVVTLTREEIKNLFSLVVINPEERAFVITQTNESGIGATTRVATKEGAVDITDYSVW